MSNDIERMAVMTGRMLGEDGSVINVADTLKGAAGTVLIPGTGSGAEALTTGFAKWTGTGGTLTMAKDITVLAASTAYPGARYAITVYAKKLTDGITLATSIKETVAIGDGAAQEAAFASFANAAIGTGVTVTEIVQGVRLPFIVRLTPSAAATTGDCAYVKVEQV